MGIKTNNIRSSGDIRLSPRDVPDALTVDESGNTTLAKPLYLKGSASGTVGIKVPAASSNYEFTLPAAQGDADTALVNDGLGGLVWGSAGDPSFKLAAVLANGAATLRGGYLQIGDGRTLATYDGAGTLSTDFAQNLVVSLPAILGSAPTANTTYYLYIYLDAVQSNAITLTDNGRELFPVTQGQLRLLTQAPTVVDRTKYIPLAFARTAADSSWSPALKGDLPRFVYDLFASYYRAPEEYVAPPITTSTTSVFTHGLSGKPSVIELYYFDGSAEYPVDTSSHVTAVGVNGISVSSVGLTFGAGQELRTRAYYFPTANTSAVVPNVNYASAWLTSTALTALPHNLGVDGIRGYEVQELETATGQIRNIDRGLLVSYYTPTQFFLDWSFLTPSPTLQYRIVAGASPVVSYLPTTIGGFTKFVGAGPNAFATLSDALAQSASGDAILIGKSYSISSPEVVSIPDIKIEFSPGVTITVTAGARALDISAADVHVIRPYYLLNAGAAYTDGIRIAADDCCVERAKIILNNSGATLSSAYTVTALASRVHLVAAVQTLAGTVTTTLTDLGTDTDAAVRG